MGRRREMTEERTMTKRTGSEALEVLEMVKDGRVTPEQGAELLEALKSRPYAIAAAGGDRPRFVRVRVNVREKDGEGDKVAVNANLPIAMADLALKMMETAKITKDGETIEFGRYLKDLGGMDIATILQMVKDGAEGKLVDVNIDGEDGEQVQVEVIVD